MMHGDKIEDYNPATSHLYICAKNETSEARCNRDCTNFLYDLAARLSRLVNG